VTLLSRDSPSSTPPLLRPPLFLFASLALSRLSALSPHIIRRDEGEPLLPRTASRSLSHSLTSSVSQEVKHINCGSEFRDSSFTREVKVVDVRTKNKSKVKVIEVRAAAHRPRKDGRTE
jgi:hypothetical protein